MSLLFCYCFILSFALPLFFSCLPILFNLLPVSPPLPLLSLFSSLLFSSLLYSALLFSSLLISSLLFSSRLSSRLVSSCLSSSRLVSSPLLSSPLPFSSLLSPDIIFCHFCMTHLCPTGQSNQPPPLLKPTGPQLQRPPPLQSQGIPPRSQVGGLQGPPPLIKPSIRVPMQPQVSNPEKNELFLPLVLGGRSDGLVVSMPIFALKVKHIVLLLEMLDYETLKVSLPKRHL